MNNINSKLFSYPYFFYLFHKKFINMIFQKKIHILL